MKKRFCLFHFVTRPLHSILGLVQTLVTDYFRPGSDQVHSRHSWILDSTQGFRITVIWILCKYLGFHIPVLSWIPGFFELYSTFHGPNFPGFRNLESLTRGDQMIRPWLRRAKGYPTPKGFQGLKLVNPRCKKNYTLSGAHKTLSNNKKSLKEHFTNLLCIFPTSWLATGGEPDRRRKKIMTHEPTNR